MRKKVVKRKLGDFTLFEIEKICEDIRGDCTRCPVSDCDGDCRLVHPVFSRLGVEIVVPAELLLKRVSV